MTLLVLLACAAHLPPTMSPEEVVTYETADGWRADVRHYPGEGPPVLLVHGMGANHYNWDYREEVSLAHHLQERGWDVWIPELRGDPGSRAPSRRARRSISFDGYARHDVPAAVDAVLAVTGEEQLYWVGHSMGGMLLYTTLSQRPEKVAAGVAVCSPVEFEALLGIHRKLARLGWAFRGRGRIEADGPARLATGILGRANPLYRRLANPDNLEWPVVNGLARHALVDLPRRVAWQASDWLRSGELRTVEGEPWIASADVPLLVLGGAVDRVVPAPNVAAACEVFPDCTYRLLGTEGGFTTDYGHVDPVVGRTARSEVYPVITTFLEAHRHGEAHTAAP